MTTATQRQGWEILKKDQKLDREKTRVVRSRQRAIGRELRRMFDDVAQEPVPDDFMDLLRKIDTMEPGGSA
ncbi:MAG TPA: NepR family anti-sigma factor [Rhizomicrobium sp.]|jgi:hypothetical protein|nr:NepR family anti-sigma factor [Rhizomicrobium sp.]